MVDDGVRRLVKAGVIAHERVGAGARACRGLIVSVTMDYLSGNQDLDPGLAHRLVGDLLRGFGEPGATGQGNLR